MKKNRTMRIATLMLALTLITCCFVGSTFAKYTSTATGTDSITVAKWAIMLDDDADDDKNIAVNGAAPTIEFDLASAITDTGNGDVDNVTAGFLAPGTKGSFNFKVQNTSEVAAKIRVTFTAESTNNEEIVIPVVYSKDGNDWTEDITTLVYDKDHAIGDPEETITIQWMWAFNNTDANAHRAQTDANDTKLGVLAQNDLARPTITVRATIEATQID